MQQPRLGLKRRGEEGGGESNEKRASKEEAKRSKAHFFILSRSRETSPLVQAHGLAHRRLDVERTHVLPVLLEQRDQEVDRHLDVDVELLFFGFRNFFFSNDKLMSFFFRRRFSLLFFSLFSPPPLPLLTFSASSTLPTATPMHSTFFSWNLTDALISVTLASSDSE